MIRTMALCVAINCLAAGLASAEPPGATAITESATSPSTMERGTWDLTLALGVEGDDALTSGITGSDTRPAEARQLAGLFGVRYALTDRLELGVLTPSLAYRAGRHGEFEWIPWGGVTGWAIGYSSLSAMIYAGQLGAGVDTRRWLGAETTLNLSAGARSTFGKLTDFSMCGSPCSPSTSWQGPTTWRARVSAGLSHQLGDRVTLNVAVSAAQDIVVDGDPAAGGLMSDERESTISIGSVQERALRALPLLEVRVGERWSLDGYAGATYHDATGEINERYMLGFTKMW